MSIVNPKSVYLRVSKKAAYMIGTTAFLRVDQRISIYDCLHALLLPSGNDAAVVLATAFGKWLYFSIDKARKGPPLAADAFTSIPGENENEKIQAVHFEYGHD